MNPVDSPSSGNVVHLVTLIVVLPFAAWNLWTASQYGYVHGRFGNTTRANQPVIFWIFVGASALCCVAGSYLAACAFLGVPTFWYP
jgi:hypothetical protein